MTIGHSDSRLGVRLWCVVGLTLVAASLVFGYFHLFSHFADYDDMGTMMLSVRHFLDGPTFYDDMETPYGPCYFAFKRLLHGPLVQIPLTHDAVLLTALVLWTASAAIVGLAVFRLTGRPFWGLLSYLATYLHLSTIANEPGHPQELLGIILVALPAVACLVPKRRSAAAALGALAAAAVLTKVNVGVFVALSSTIALLACAGVDPSRGMPGRRFAWTRILGASYVGAAMAGVALPFVLMKSQLAEPWVLRYALIISSATLPVLVVAWLDGPQRNARGPARESTGVSDRQTGSLAGESATLRPQDMIVFLISGVLTAAVLVGFVVARGTTLLGLFDSLVVRPGEVYTTGAWGWPTPTWHFGLIGSALSVVLAVCYVRRHRSSERVQEGLAVTVVVLKASVALFTFYIVSRWRVHPYPLFSFVLPWAWLVLAFPRPAETASGESRPRAVLSGRFARVLLAAVAVFQPLQTYPVPGSQSFFGSLLLIPIAAILLYDVTTWLTARVNSGEPAGILAARQLRPLSTRRSMTYLVPGAALIPIMTSVLVNTFVVVQIYRWSVPLSLEGTSQMRLDERRAATFQFLVRNLKDHSDRFVCNIGFNSLYLWTGRQPPTARFHMPHVPSVLPAEQQREMIAKLQSYPNRCLVMHPLLFPRPAARTELEDYFAAEFRSVGSVGKYRFCVGNGRSDVRLTDCAIWNPGSVPACPQEVTTATLRLAGAAGRSIGRLVIYDLDREEVVGDTRFRGPPAENTAVCTVLDEQGREIRLSSDVNQDVDATHSRNLTLRLDRRQPVPEDHFLVVRLFDPRGRWLKSVPFVRLSEGDHRVLVDSLGRVDSQ